tara:strand:- start:7589 stop:8077 length:489 start_codon:yes stop_codon:yes gene_type:complete
MKSFKNITAFSFITLITIGFFQCASVKPIESKSPLQIGEVYYQNWTAGIEGGGSGYNIFIPIESNSNDIVLDSMYFRGKSTKIEYANDALLVGRFETKADQKQDIIMSNEPYAEYGNKVPELPQKTPFNLNDDDCVVSYLENDKIKYFKIDGIVKKESTRYR